VLCGSFGLLSLKDVGCVVCVLWFTFSQRFGLCCVSPLVYFLSKIWVVLCGSFGLLSLKDLGCVVCVLWFTFSQRFGLCCVCPLVYLEKVNQRTHTTQPKSLRESKPKDTHNTTQIFERK
jgi:hypothetical protein